MLNVFHGSKELTPLKPSGEELELSIRQVRAATEAGIQGKTNRNSQNSSKPKTVQLHSEDKDYIIRIAEKRNDPFDPSRFRTRKSIALQEDDPETIMTAPLKKLTPEEEKYWNIPPCVSNWRNPAGNVIPLDKRVAADGRRNQRPELSDKFAPFTRALEQTMSSINEAAKQRAIQQRQLLLKQQQEEEERQKEEIRKLRDEKLKLALKRTKEEKRHEKLLREHIEERKRIKQKKRDISAAVSDGRVLSTETYRQNSGEDVFDTNLFGRNAGIDHGYGDEDSYNVYDQPLFKQPNEKLYVPFSGSRKYTQTDEVIKGSQQTISKGVNFTKGETQKPLEREGLYIPNKS